MNSKLGIVLLLFVLNFNGVANQNVGAGLVPARVTPEQDGQGQALPLQNNSSLEFSLAILNPDGNPIAKQRGRKHRQRRTQRRAKVHRVITLTPVNVMGKPNAVSEPAEPATMSAPGAGQEPTVGSSPPTRARPPIDVNKTGAPSPAKSAPGIKPPTVNIKPPTR